MFAKRVGVFSLAIGVSISACSAPGTRNVMPTPVQDGIMAPQGAVPGFTLSKYVKHVVIIVQENRSFDNLFAGFKGANAPMYGYAKSNGKEYKVNFKSIDF